MKVEQLKKQIEHWKELDRYEYDPIFKDVVNEFEKHIKMPQSNCECSPEETTGNILEPVCNICGRVQEKIK